MTSREPAWRAGDGWGVGPEPELRIGAVEGDPAYLFGSVWDATRLPDGRIAVVDGQSYEIRVYGADGRHRATFGGRGDGPGEFGGPPFLAVASPDTLVAWDPGNYRITWFDPEGGVLRDRSLVTTIGELGIPRFPNGLIWQFRSDGMLLWTGPDDSNSRRQGLRERRNRFILLGDHGEAVHDYGSFPSSQSYMTQRADGVGIGIGNPFAPRSAVALGPEPTAVAISSGTEWEVRVHTADGRLRRILRAAIARAAVTSEMLDAERAELPEVAERMGMPLGPIEDAFDQLPIPDSIPAIARMYRDAAGRLWVGRRTGDIWSVSEYDVFDSDGRWLGTVRIPDGIVRILEIGEDYMLAHWLDELDVSYLHMYRIEKSRTTRGG